MKVLVNAVGISDSGGVVVLEKLLEEFIKKNKRNKYILLVTKNSQINAMVQKYKEYPFLVFKPLSFDNYINRLYYENVSFRRLITEQSIDLVYNFSGSMQFLLGTPQLIKIHNLIFYSRKLHRFYINNKYFSLWIKHLFFKGLVFRFMLARSKFIEIQSKHVIEKLTDFVDVSAKQLYIKSDIDVVDDSFSLPREYDFAQKLKILCIVGPHFSYPHKNLFDFTQAMLKLKRSNIDFEINITLTKAQLNRSKLWDHSLNSLTNFHGYLSDRNDIDKLFTDNTILVSTSIIESLGLHVIEAVKKGVVTITPSENYAFDVYGSQKFSYELFDPDSLCRVILNLVREAKSPNSQIIAQQQYLKQNEISKINNIVSVFDDILGCRSQNT